MREELLYQLEEEKIIHCNFSESQLRAMGILEPELWDLNFHAPDQCVQWLDDILEWKIYYEEQIKITKKSIRNDKIGTNFLIIYTSFCVILFLSVLIFRYTYHR